MTTKPLTVEISITVYCQVDSSNVGGEGGTLYIEACLSDLLPQHS